MQNGFLNQRIVVAGMAAAVIITCLARGDSGRAAEAPSARQAVSDFQAKHFPGTKPKAVALVFVLSDCPVANSYMPEYSRLHKDFAGRGIPVVLLYVDPELDQAAVAKHAREHELKCPAITDRDQQWVQLAGATVTPEAAVISPTGEVLYRGRIDDRYPAPGQRRAQPTKHELRDALDDILAGRQVRQPRTEAVGCLIPDRN